MTIGAASARPALFRSSYSNVSPCADEKVAVSRAAAKTSSKRDSTQ